MTLETLQKEMVAAMKNKDKARKETISSLIGAIKKTAIDEKCKDNITEELVNRIILKEKKTVQEMIDTCPDTEQYASRKAEYVYNMMIVDKYAPQMITDSDEISNFIIEICKKNGIEIIPANRGTIMKTVMPILKSKNCDMKIAQDILKTLF